VSLASSLSEGRGVPKSVDDVCTCRRSRGRDGDGAPAGLVAAVVERAERREHGHREWYAALELLPLTGRERPPRRSRGAAAAAAK